MEFNKRYNRTEFVDFLQHKFLPEDFVVETTSGKSSVSCPLKPSDSAPLC